MTYTIPIKPVSVNQVWQGRRFKTPLYKRYEKECLALLAGQPKAEQAKEYDVTYRFYIKNFALTDAGNLEKPLTDILCKAGLMKDDRYIRRLTLEKHRARGEERIEVEIEEYQGSCFKNRSILDL